MVKEIHIRRSGKGPELFLEWLSMNPDVKLDKIKIGSTDLEIKVRANILRLVDCRDYINENASGQAKSKVTHNRQCNCYHCRNQYKLSARE